MIEFWLIVSLSVGGGEWTVMEDVKQPTLEACLSAVADRVQKAERSHLADEDGKAIRDEYEVAVTCSVHRAHEEAL
jgi:hypothetical protein